MNPERRNSTIYRISLILSMLILASLACSIGGISIGKDSTTMRINIDQDQINSWVENIDDHHEPGSNELLEKITRVEMHDGYMSIFGESENVSGSFDISIGAEEDVLKVQIIDVDIPSVNMDDPRIIEANEDLAKELSEMVTESNGEVLFKEAAVEEGELKLQIELVYQE